MVDLLLHTSAECIRVVPGGEAGAFVTKDVEGVAGAAVLAAGLC